MKHSKVTVLVEWPDDTSRAQIVAAHNDFEETLDDLEMRILIAGGATVVQTAHDLPPR